MDKAKKSNNFHYNKALLPFARANRKNMTKSAACMWKYVLSKKQMNGYQFRRERPILKYIVDFVSLELMLIIEVDGISHDDNVSRLNDRKRDQKLNEVGFTVLRFSSWEVLNEITDVGIKIGEWIRSNAKTPPSGKRNGSPNPLKGETTNFPLEGAGGGK